MFLVRTQKAKGQTLCTVNLIVQNWGNPEKKSQTGLSCKIFWRDTYFTRVHQLKDILCLGIHANDNLSFTDMNLATLSEYYHQSDVFFEKTLNCCTQYIVLTILHNFRSCVDPWKDSNRNERFISLVGYFKTIFTNPNFL